MAKILIVDDEKSIRKTLREILEYEKYEVDEASDGMACLAKVKSCRYDIIILDIKMPNMDGTETLERLQIMAPDIPVLMISGHATIDTAVESVKKGAFDFISKPPDLNRLLITLRNALDHSHLVTEKKVLKKRVKECLVQEIVGNSPAIQHIKDTIDRVAPTDARVLITGENGTGKELVARWLHHKSSRKDSPIVEVNCAAIPAELIESELFGHEKGSFTSAVKQRIGKFEQANGGTLFLDEIGDMSLSAQAKVLRALQESYITRVGGDKVIKVDVRVIAATNKDLTEEIQEGRFREDLYHRIAVIPIRVPSLNERKEDIPLLVDHFSASICNEQGMASKPFDKKCIEELINFDWTGNIRELRNVIERLLILSGKSVSVADFRNYVYPPTNQRSRISEIFTDFESIDEIQDFVTAEYKKFKDSKA